jgi:hypothetical protein
MLVYKIKMGFYLWNTVFLFIFYLLRTERRALVINTPASYSVGPCS